MRLPPLDGEFSGTFHAKLWPGAPALPWKITVHDGEPGQRAIAVEAQAAGTRLRLRAELSEATRAGTWSIEEGSLDIARWWPALAPTLGETAQALTASGVIELSGGGELRDGAPSGVVKIVLREGAVRHPTDGWTLEGVSLAGSFSVDARGAAVRSDGPLELTVKTITTMRFGARNLLVRALLENLQSLSVREARIEIAGGDAMVDPCTVPLSPLSLDVKLRLVRVGLQDLAALVPQALTEARGRADGSLGLRWNAETGVVMGAGQFAVRSDEPAVVRLAPTPGLISGSLPESVLQYYPGLGQIETGEVPLRAELLEVVFTPEGDSEGRTARVRLTGGPVDPRLRAPIDLTINVRGPLDALVRFGTDSRLSFGGP
jgi:hypothetical protein